VEPLVLSILHIGQNTELVDYSQARDEKEMEDLLRNSAVAMFYISGHLYPPS
jgi:hypothetical protein